MHWTNVNKNLALARLFLCLALSFKWVNFWPQSRGTGQHLKLWFSCKMPTPLECRPRERMVLPHIKVFYYTIGCNSLHDLGFGPPFHEPEATPQMFCTLRDSKFLLLAGLLLPAAGTYEGVVHQPRLLACNHYAIMIIIVFAF